MKNLRTKASIVLTAMAVQTFAGLSVSAEETSFSARLSMLDERGNYMEALSGETTLYGELELSSVPGGEADVFVGAYDTDGKLVSVGKTEMAADETKAEFEFATTGEQVSVQAFVWGENQKPLVDKINVWNVTSKGLYEWFGLACDGAYQTTSEDVSMCWMWGDTPETIIYRHPYAIDEHLILNDAGYAGKWVQFCVTVDGVTYKSEPKQITSYPIRGAETISDARRTSADEYVFEVDGVEFVLLEETDSDTAKFKIMSKNGLGDAVSYCPYFNPVGGAEAENLPQAVKDVQAGNPNVTGVISFHGMYYYLNNDFKNMGYIPQSVLDNIDNSIQVITNTGPWGNVECIMPIWGGITLPDINEVIKYKDRIGFADDDKNWWTRSVINSGYDYIYVKGADSANYNTTASGFQVPWDQIYAYVRPMMYLNRDFFKTVKLDLSKVGAEIKKTIRRVCSYDELLELGYTAEELALYYTGSEISNLTISGEMGQGTTLTASVDGDATFEWQVANTIDGVYETMATGESYSPSLDVNGKYLKVVAYATNGESLSSDPQLIVSLREDFAGTLSDVQVRGIFYAGNYLYAGYTLNDMTEDEVVSYAWYVSDAETGTYTLAGNESSVATEDIEFDRWYYCVITIADGTTYQTPVQKVDKRIWARWDEDGTNDPGNIAEATELLSNAPFDYDFEYSFSVDGHSFILLDTIQTSDTARYKVISADSYGLHWYRDLKGEGFTSLLPESIVAHADPKVFRTGTLNGGWIYTIGGCIAADAEYSGYHAFYPANMDDYVKYRNFIGLKVYNHTDALVSDEPTPVIYATHTNSLQAADRATYALGVINDELQIVNNCDNAWGWNGYPYEIRPVFYLDKDFFTEVETEFIGIEAQKMIAAAIEGVGAL